MECNTWQTPLQTVLLLFYAALWIMHVMQSNMKDKLFFPLVHKQTRTTKHRDGEHRSGTAPAQLPTSPTTLKVTITHNFTALRTMSWKRQSSENSAQPQPLKTSLDFITTATRDGGVNHTEEGKREELPCKVRKRSETAQMTHSFWLRRSWGLECISYVDSALPPLHIRKPGREHKFYILYSPWFKF